MDYLMGLLMGLIIGTSLIVVEDCTTCNSDWEQLLLERGHMKMVCVGTECTAEWVEEE